MGPLGLYAPLSSPYTPHYAQRPASPVPNSASLPAEGFREDIVNILVFCVDKGTEAELQRATMHQADVIL